jgi:hypothetical protein
MKAQPMLSLARACATAAGSAPPVGRIDRVSLLLPMQSNSATGAVLDRAPGLFDLGSADGERALRQPQQGRDHHGGQGSNPSQAHSLSLAPEKLTDTLAGSDWNVGLSRVTVLR